jgi:acetyl esterase
MARLDPQLAAVVADVEREGIPPWHALSVEDARRVEDEVFSAEEVPPVARVREFEIPGPAGGIPVRIYRHAASPPAPTLVFYHGGGWVLGTLDSIDPVCRALARRADCVVVSVDYRLAPRHPFPAPLDDAYAALEWVAEYAGSVGGDPDRVAVGGTSAGGNLAAATALRAREFDGPDVAAQALCYPITDFAFDTDSYDDHGDGPLLTEADMRWFWDHYLRSPVDGHNPFASPLRADSLAELPPAVVATAGHDPLRDEGAAYATRLDDAGVDVDHRHYPELAHGFLSLTADVDAADAAMDEVAASLRQRFA